MSSTPVEISNQTNIKNETPEEVAAATQKSTPNVSDSVDALISHHKEEIVKLREAIVTLKQIKKVHRAEVAEGGKKKKKIQKVTSGPRSPSGITKKGPISEELCRFLGVEAGTELARTEVTKKIIVYIKENGLQDPGKKQYVVPDVTLSQLLDVRTGQLVHFFGLQKYLSKHFLKASTVETVSV
ncbi:hypothetical protein HDU93_005098 [Gonapodya sp. JEL0774]|nr:hypothetical protein HDU93_005098 [Gonapodya sp. JEL0774]